ncbi:MAG: UPF0146 family protein [Halobacteriota archaeon]
MEPADPPAIVDVLADYERVVEVGIGNRTDVARDLAERGSTVIATDVVQRDVPAGVTFVRDDVTTPETEGYEDADAIYALRLPPELQRHVWRVARAVEADLLFTTLGGDPALVPADPRTVAEGTLFVASHN